MFFVLFFLLSITYTSGLPQGAPVKACETLRPFHGGGIPPQNTASPYSIHLRRHNGAVIVKLESNIHIPFQGFMLQARTPNRELLGTFQPEQNTLVQTLDCAQPGDTVTHRDPKDKSVIEVEWHPPEDYDGLVIFNSTFLQHYQTFWVGVESQPVQVGKRAVNDPIPNIVNNRKSTTPPNFFPEITTKAEIVFDPFYEGCGTTKLCFGAPSGCIESKNCKAVSAVTVSGNKYEFEMKATGNAAWVGVGLSEDNKMGDDSVIECAKRGSSVKAYMSWTTGIPNYGAQRLANAQLGIQLLNGSIVDDTLYCRVRRDATTKIRGNTFDLVNNKYYLLIAAGKNADASSVHFHDITFLASATDRSLSDVSTLAGASKLLIRLHGSFMLAAWIGTASIGILLARYYRTTWVGSSLCGKDLWFAWHRMFMILTWALTMTGFILIFVELKAWSAENNPHAILGTVTTILCFLQPIGAYFRPHPGTPRRSIFNWVHWLGGNAAHIIGIVAIFFAVKLTKAELPDTMDWILVAYVAFHVVIHLVLSIMGCISEKSSERKVTSFPMKDLGGSGRSSAYADRTADAPYSVFRKFILAIYILVILVLVVALIVITALAPIWESWEKLKKSMENSK